MFIYTERVLNSQLQCLNNETRRTVLSVLAAVAQVSLNVWYDMVL